MIFVGQLIEFAAECQIVFGLNGLEGHRVVEEKARRLIRQFRSGVRSAGQEIHLVAGASLHMTNLSPAPLQLVRHRGFQGVGHLGTAARIEGAGKGAPITRRC